MPKSASAGQKSAIILGGLAVVAVLWIAPRLIPCALHPERCNKCPPVPDPDPPCTINLVLDTSASMRGFFTGQTEFKDTLTRLASALDKLKQEPATPHCPHSIAFQYYNSGVGTLVSAAADSREFDSQLLDDKIPTGKESPLQIMLERVVDESSGISTVRPPTPTASHGPAPCLVAPSDSKLSILVTDSIFSYSDNEIAKNRNINKENIEGLAQDVGVIFNKAHALGKSVSVLALKSQFHGTYYNYQNGKSAWGSTLRPYYLWVVGTSANIRALRTSLLAEGISSDHAIDFSADRFDSFPTILQYTESKGTWNRHNGENPKRIHIRRPFPDGRNKDADPDQKAVGFAVALDLSHLSADQLSGDYLANHLRVDSLSPDLQIKSKVVKTRAEIEGVLDPNDRADILRATHVVLITTDFRFVKTAQMSVSVDDALPSWYLTWSNEDDTKTDAHTLESTFGFRHFVDAIAQAYSLRGPITQTTILLER